MNQLSPQLLGKGNLQGTRILFLISIENSGRCVAFTSTSQLQPHLPLGSCSQVLCPSLTLLFLHLPPSSTFLLPPAFVHIPTSKNLLRKKKQGTLTQFSSDLHDSSVREYTFLEMDSAPILAFPLPNSTQTSSQHSPRASREADRPAPGGPCRLQTNQAVPLQPVSTWYEEVVPRGTCYPNETPGEDCWACGRDFLTFLRTLPKGESPDVYLPTHTCSSPYNGVTSQ